MLPLKSAGELGSSGCEGGNAAGCGWMKEDMGGGEIKLRLWCEVFCIL